MAFGRCSTLLLQQNIESKDRIPEIASKCCDFVEQLENTSFAGEYSFGKLALYSKAVPLEQRLLELASDFDTGPEGQDPPVQPLPGGKVRNLLFSPRAFLMPIIQCLD